MWRRGRVRESVLESERIGLGCGKRREDRENGSGLGVLTRKCEEVRKYREKTGLVSGDRGHDGSWPGIREKDREEIERERR